MKKIIILFYCRICVDILGFPIYLQHTKQNFTTKKNEILLMITTSIKLITFYINQI